MKVNAMEEEFEDVTVLGHPMLFTCLQVDRDTVPKGLFLYEVRHDDDQQGNPVQIGNWIMVNHFGTLLTNAPIPLEPNESGNNAYRDIDPMEDWNYEGSVSTVSEYMKKNPPAVRKGAVEEGILSPEAMEKLKQTVQNFVRKEYEEELDQSAFDDLTCIGIAETNEEDHEEIVIDMAINVKDLTLDQYVNGEKLDSWHYASLDDLLDEIRHISFDELVSLGPNAENRVEQLIQQSSLEHDFLRNPEDSYAIYQLKHSPSGSLLMFSGMKELTRAAQAFREEIYATAKKLSTITIQGKADAEALLRDMGMDVVPKDDRSRITLRNGYGMTGDILLAYDDHSCRADRCDTRELEMLVRRENYSMVYSGPLESKRSTDQILEDLFEKFNLDRPPLFAGHSMSVSDVVMLKQNGQVSSYFCDHVGFTEVPDFLADQPLLNAEILLEDDYDMIDGVLNNGCKQEEKPSLRDQLESIRTELQSNEHPRPERKHDNNRER